MALETRGYGTAGDARDQAATATVIVAELGDIRRFGCVRKLMSFLGHTSMEHSSGDKRSQSAISKAGNPHARVFLVESAQHYKKPPRISQDLAQRQRSLPKDIQAIAWKAQVRLHKRYWHLVNSGKNNNKATVAVARELIGFIWDIYRAVPIR